MLMLLPHGGVTPTGKKYKLSFVSPKGKSALNYAGPLGVTLKHNVTPTDLTDLL